MKVAELMEASYSGRRIWRHHGHENFGIRVEVTKDQRTEVVKKLSDLLRSKDAKEGDISMFPVVWSSPEQASTFPAAIRLVLKQKDERSNREEMAGQMMTRVLKAAIKKVFKEVLGIEVSVALESDHDANGLRYIDTKVNWVGRYDK